MAAMSVRVEIEGPVTTVVLDRPEARNAVDGPTAAALAETFGAFDADPAQSVAVLHGTGGTFCAGADLKAIVVPVGQARAEAEALAHQLAALPQECLRQDRLSLLEQEGLSEQDALANELRHGMVSLAAGAVEGAQRFAAGEGRHGRS